MKDKTWLLFCTALDQDNSDAVCYVNPILTRASTRTGVPAFYLEADTRFPL
jgi:hypothetical protein